MVPLRALQQRYRDVASRLKSERQKAELTQAELAQELNLTQSQYSKIERGDVKGTTEFWQAAARRLGCSMDWLLGGNGATSTPGPSLREQLTRDADVAEGLRAFLGNTVLVETIAPSESELQALQALEREWAGAERITRDGWVAILLALRSVSR